MKKEFKVGEKIRFVCAAHMNGKIATVDYVHDDGGLNIKYDNTEETIHPRQVTHRIVPKKKPVAREIYLYQENNFLKLNSATLNKEIAEEVLEPNEKIITFREVLPNKKLFTPKHIDAIENTLEDYIMTEFTKKAIIGKLENL